MLFYESAACLHGRRKRFKGKYYASVFSHYQPVDGEIWNYTVEVSIIYGLLKLSSILGTIFYISYNPVSYIINSLLY